MDHPDHISPEMYEPQYVEPTLWVPERDIEALLWCRRNFARVQFAASGVEVTLDDGQRGYGDTFLTAVVDCIEGGRHGRIRNVGP